ECVVENRVVRAGLDIEHDGREDDEVRELHVGAAVLVAQERRVDEVELRHPVRPVDEHTTAPVRSLHECAGVLVLHHRGVGTAALAPTARSTPSCPATRSSRTSNRLPAKWMSLVESA